MSRGFAQIVSCLASARNGAVLKHNAVVDKVGLNVPWEGAVSQETITEVDTLQIENSGISLSERALHLVLQIGIRRDVFEPASVVDPIRRVEIKSKSVWLVVRV